MDGCGSGDAENRRLLHQPAAGPGVAARRTTPAPDMLSESCSLPLPPSRPPWPDCSVLSLPGDQGWLLPAPLDTLHTRVGHWLLCCKHRMVLKEHGRFCTMSFFRDLP